MYPSSAGGPFTLCVRGGCSSKQALIAVRSAGLLFKNALSASKFPTRQYCSYRVRQLHALHLRAASYSGGDRVRPAKPSHLNGVRSRSCWSPNRLTAALARYRLKSSWHKPGCKWVRSEGDPRSTPRDKECPACRHEEETAVELSQRELLWERHVEEMRKFVERDPYEALFGRSNGRLRGLLGKAWPAGMWGERTFPWWVGKGWAGPAIPRNNNGNELGRNNLRDVEDSKPGADTAHTATPTQPQHYRTQHVIHGMGSWRVSGISSGKTFEASGEFEYDPITMRMVPKKPKASISPAPNLEVKKHQVSDTTAKVQVKNSNGCIVPEPATGKVQEHGKIEESKEATPSSESLLLKRKREGETRFSITTQTPPTLAPMIREEPPSNLPSTAKSDVESRDEMRRTWARVWMETTMTQHQPKAQSKGTDLESNEPKITAEQQTQDKKTMNTKQALEQSWAKETASRKDARRESREPESHHKGQTNAKNQEPQPLQDVDPGKISPQQTHPALLEAIARRIALSSSLSRKDTPLKHFTKSQLTRHKQVLIQRFQKMQKEPKPETGADKKLKEEIQKQKTAMMAFENKWHHRRAASETQAVSKQSPSTVASTLSASPRSATGRSDGRMNPPSFEQFDRTYKNNAAHTLAAEEQKLHDRALVKDIREIYENTYGIIDSEHTQGKPRTSVKDDSQSVEQSRPSQDTNDDIAKTVSPLGTSAGETQATKPVETARPQGNTSEKLTSTYDPSIYTILAYDPSSHSIYTATASSSFTPPTGDAVLPFTDAISRLHAPAKFLPHLAKHQGEGYEVVSANRHLLVLKRVRPAKESPVAQATSASSEPARLPEQPLAQASSTTSRASLSTDPVDGSSSQYLEPPPTPQAGNFASPTGFVNHDVFPAEPTRPSRIPSRDNPRVRKEEAVFSGASLKQSRSKRPEHAGAMSSGDGSGAGGGGGGPRRGSTAGDSFGKSKEHQRRRSSRFKRSLKRMVLVGAWMAACCYATGVVIEYFRNGPSNGGNGEGGPGGERTSWGEPRRISGSLNGSAKRERGRKDAEPPATAGQLRAQRPRSEWDRIKQGDSIVWKLGVDIALVVLAGYVVRTYLGGGN